MSLPRNLGFAINKLSNHSKNVIRVTPIGTDSFVASDIVSVRLPSNTIIDLHSFTMLFDGYASKSGGVGAAADAYAFARNIQSVIDRIEISINGQIINGNLSDYNSLFNLLTGLTYDADTKAEKEIYSHAADLPGNPGQDSVTQYAITDWMGFLSGKYVRFIDTALLGQVEIRFHLASVSKAMVSDGAAANIAAGHYQLSKTYFTMETISFADNMYREVLASRLKQGGIPIYFDNWMSFSNSMTAATGTTTLSVSSQSLNKMIATRRALNWQAGGPRGVDGGNSPAYKFDATPITSSQFVVDDMTFPAYKPTAKECYLLTKQAFDLNATTYTNDLTSDTFLSNQWCHALNFTHHTDEPYVSGIDTRGMATNMQYVAEGSNGAADSSYTIFVNMTSMLLVESGQVLTVVN